ncbi:MAG: nitrite reductase [Desulfobulbaceae bacterium]|nr:nitrite reductase [Desulfobulbaceae bacterium]
MNITVLLPAGRLPLDIMNKAHEMAAKFNLGVYLSTAQNLRLINVPEENADEVKAELAALGADFKAPGKFPLPRVCVGKDHCNLGVVETEDISNKILEKFKYKTTTKPKFKIAVSGCTLCCSGVMTTDIGVVATRGGFDVYAGGKGGPHPKTARRIISGATEEEMLDAIVKLVDFHDKHTKKKQRMIKLLDHPEFPWPEAA